MQLSFYTIKSLENFKKTNYLFLDVTILNYMSKNLANKYPKMVREEGID